MGHGFHSYVSLPEGTHLGMVKQILAIKMVICSNGPLSKIIIPLASVKKLCPFDIHEHVGKTMSFLPPIFLGMVTIAPIYKNGDFPGGWFSILLPTLCQYTMIYPRIFRDIGNWHWVYHMKLGFIPMISTILVIMMSLITIIFNSG